MNVYVLSELSIWPLLADVVRRRPVTILGVWARLRLFAPVLNRLAALLVRLAWVDDIAEIPGLPWHERMPGRGGFYNDVHHRAESELWRRFDLPADDPLAAQYSYAFRKATTGTVGSLTPIYLTVEWLSENRPADSWRLIGAPPLLQELADILAPPLPPFTPDRKFLALSNAVNQIIRHRGDYSSEHTVHNLELCKPGRRCIGMAHGLPINTYVHMWREVDFDVYFTFGRDLTRYYANSWAPGMKIIPTGPFRPHDVRQRIGSVQQRCKDIIFLAMAAVKMLKTRRVVCDVAAHFQERRVFVKMKHGRSQEDNALFTEILAGASANPTIATDDTYELMLAASYALTSGFSTTVEALASVSRLLSLMSTPPCVPCITATSPV
ncbi:MAG: hypothetical protein FD176_337 [Rhodospirillaceae bacterium]|nr:MAG: hypothetical protein FD176_337 [Rhodospirillaceae bacterium]TNC97414.1 MAG: hypothetical protein FD119_1014 [Stygiobacter sp.]